MNKFVKDVLKTIDSHNMIERGHTVIAAVSGGFDSICMLHVLCSLAPIRKFNLCAAHINHLFRHDSNQDEQYVADLCEKWHIKLYTKRVDVKKCAALNKMSFETAGREVRYAFFNELLDTISNSVVATAHNANDNAESVIMHLLRGSGLSGLTGIKPVRGKIIRPIIERTRTEIELYCSDYQLAPKTDYTNFDDTYTRNDIRLNLMPHIAKRGGAEAIVRAANLLATDEDFLVQHTEYIFDKYVAFDENKYIIDIKDFNKLHLSLQRRLIRRILADTNKQIGLLHIDSIISIARKNYGGKRASVPGGIVAQIEKGKLIVLYRGE
ncbi:MAG: tRNA lysidine(34) synthetase TilS [Clostridiaceae bacterium]|nr:tRNA lysidine(34) synthetase TilS [Clostridiaceae bacterium]